MFWSVFKFEVNFHRRQHMVYIVSGIFFLLTFAATTSDNVTIGGGTSNLNINAPFTIIQTLAMSSLLALFAAVAYAAGPVPRDFEYKTAELIFTTRVDKFSYMFGRFFGALLYSYVIFLAALMGVLLGEFAPWLDQERIGAFSFQPYWFGIWALGIPNIFLMSSIFFCMATLTRNIASSSVSAIALLMLSFVIGTFTEPDTVALTSKLEPFGLAALGEATRYWTVFEKNAMVVTLEGNFLINRLIWTGIGVLFLLVAYRFFPFSVEMKRSEQGFFRKLFSRKVAENRGDWTDRELPTPTMSFGFGPELQQFLSQTRLETRNIVTSIPFIALLVFGIFNVIAGSMMNLGNLFGTPVYPTTPVMLNLIDGTLALSLVTVLIYYAGELLVSEKNVRIAEVMDSMPYPNWIMIAAKLSGLLVVLVAMMLVAMLAAIGIQVFKGYYQFELGLYLVGLLVFLQFPYFLMCVIAVFLQVLTRHKYLAMLTMVLYVISMIALPQMGLEHYLYRFDSPRVAYSGFTGYHHYLEPFLWYTLYWSLFGVMLLIAVHLFWDRGMGESFSTRLAVAKQRFTRPLKLLLASFFVGFACTGGFIFYNTNVLNTYITQNDTEEMQADYEKNYKKYEQISLPEIVDVYADVDIFPEEREVEVKGRYKLVNKTDGLINEIHYSVNPVLTLEKLEVPGGSLTFSDARLGYYIYTLSKPMVPGEELDVVYETAWRTPGFLNDRPNVNLTQNGTFLNNLDIFPIVGYVGMGELLDNARRRKYDLPPVKRMDDIDDREAWSRSAYTGAARVNFETVVSTSMDQIAVSPGYLQREWIEEDRGRRYFHYKMDAPIWNFYSFLSAEYRVKRDKWNDVDIEVFHLHDVNVDTMIRSSKRSLDYFTTNFSPYQYKQYRILEFPSYRGIFAQSFPNTVPFSERIGFIADLRDKEEIDYVFYVTAHELAHQWWAHQVLGADVQGSTMIVETLAQYSALMVMEKEYGTDHMRRFLRYELDRYLGDRGGELLEELPLMLVENQPYIHYRKGSLALYALKDYIGEDAVNRALRKFIDDYAFKGPPYPTTKHLIANIRAEATPAYQNLITDLFGKIILYDLKVADSSVKELPDGQYEVTIDVTAKKFEADGEGRQTEIPLDGSFDIAVLGEKQGESKVPEVLYLQKYFINENSKQFTMVVNKQPVSVGIDPFNKLVDRNPSDNTAKVGS